jgi:hypothetical protein
VLDDRTEQEMAKGRFKKEPGGLGVASASANAGDAREAARPRARPPLLGRPSRPRWSQAQERLALTYRAMGLTPEQIASKIGVTPYLVTQILLAAPARGKR